MDMARGRESALESSSRPIDKRRLCR